jgi:hypothetical protein
MKHSLKQVFVLLALIAVPQARADFSETTRSINNTGETLPEGDFEVSLGALNYGLTDSLMVTTPQPLLLPLMPGLTLKQKFEPLQGLRLTPALGASKPLFLPVTYNAGLEIGADRGARREHSYTFKLTYTHIPPRDMLELDEDANIVVKKARTTDALSTGFDYTYYTEDGNALYVGTSSVTPYIGFTFAWEHVRVGVLAFALYGWQLKEYVPGLFIDDNSYLIAPLPYIYWRF